MTLLPQQHSKRLLMDAMNVWEFGGGALLHLSTVRTAG